jgi:tetratricopeptide (TPR) repeat protein
MISKNQFLKFKPLILLILIGLIFSSVALTILFLNEKLNPEPHSIQTEPSSELNYFQKGQYYFNHDDDPAPPYDLKKAREYFDLAALENPKDNALLWYQLGRIDFLEGKFNSALYKFEKQLEYFGDQVPNVYYMIGLTYGYKARSLGEESDWEKAAEGFKKYLEFDPESPWARTDLSWVYFAQGKYELMIPVLEEGLTYTPYNPWLLNMYGLALLNTDKNEAAKKQFILAKEHASLLTPEIWGRSYPGNNPKDWAQGLTEFQEAINKNIELTVLE